MTKECKLCGKKSENFTKLNKFRGKYNPSTKKRRYPNVQWVKVPLEVTKESFKKFAGQRLKACAKCIKTLSKPR